MDVLTSSEFRRRYASLKVPTEVTVNGHVIGTWAPYAPGPGDEWFSSRTDFGTLVTGDPPIIGTHGRFGRPRPAPKPGKG
jgi:hypothetical protein